MRGVSNGQLFSLSNGGNTKTITEGITQRGSYEVVYRSFTSVPNDVYYWVLPETFKGDKVGGKENNIALRAEQRMGGGGRGWQSREVELDVSASYCPTPSCLDMFFPMKGGLRLSTQQEEKTLLNLLLELRVDTGVLRLPPTTQQPRRRGIETGEIPFR